MKDAPHIVKSPSRSATQDQYFLTVEDGDGLLALWKAAGLLPGGPA